MSTGLESIKEKFLGNSPSLGISGRFSRLLNFAEKKPKLFNSVKVLMADDDEDDVLLTKDAISSTGLPYELNWVKDGVELLEYLDEAFENPEEKFFPNIVLLDINMPRLNGVEALQKIRSNYHFDELMVIVLSSCVNKEFLSGDFDNGMVSFVQKTSDLKDFSGFFKAIVCNSFDHSFSVCSKWILGNAR